MRAKAPQNFADCFALIEREMLRGPWVLGERPSICDAYLFTVAQWLPSARVDIAIYPKVDRLVRALQQLPQWSGWASHAIACNKVFDAEFLA